MLQLKSWQAVDPSLRTIALIVSTSGAPLAEEARRAARSLAADLLVETSASDRETLYLFRRLAAAVDGLWLLPDNEALSPTVLRELLTLAATRSVGVLTFNEALLSRGALMTATAVPADIAATVARVLDRVVAGDTADLPAMTPLSAAALAVNVDVEVPVMLHWSEPAGASTQSTHDGSPHAACIGASVRTNRTALRQRRSMRLMAVIDAPAPQSARDA